MRSTSTSPRSRWEPSGACTALPWPSLLSRASSRSSATSLIKKGGIERPLGGDDDAADDDDEEEEDEDDDDEDNASKDDDVADGDDDDDAGSAPDT